MIQFHRPSLTLLSLRPLAPPIRSTHAPYTTDNKYLPFFICTRMGTKIWVHWSSELKKVLHLFISYLPMYSFINWIVFEIKNPVTKHFSIPFQLQTLCFTLFRNKCLCILKAYILVYYLFAETCRRYIGYLFVET